VASFISFLMVLTVVRPLVPTAVQRECHPLVAF